MMKKQLLKFLILCMLLSFSSSSWAWWTTGHEIIASVAYEHLSPATKKQIAALLQLPINWPPAKATKYLPNPKYLSEILNDYLLASSWADAIKPYNWDQGDIYARMHYLDVPIYVTMLSKGGLVKKNCDSVNWRRATGGAIKYTKQDNVLSASVASIKTLTSNESVRNKAIALRFLLHFAGDSYMPFHVGDPIFKVGRNKINTLGANELYFSDKTQVFVPTSIQVFNLHQFWDAGLGYYNNIPEPFDSSYDPTGTSDWSKYGARYRKYLNNMARKIEKKYGDESLNKRIDKYPEFKYWVAQNAKLACKIISARYYDGLLTFPIVKEPDYKVQVEFTKGDYFSYKDRLGSVAEKQLYIAGMHLAYLLNAIFDPQNHQYLTYVKYVQGIAKNNNIKPLDDLVAAIVSVTSNKN